MWESVHLQINKVSQYLPLPPAIEKPRPFSPLFSVTSNTLGITGSEGFLRLTVIVLAVSVT